MSRAAFRLTDAGGIPELHKSPTRLVCVVRQPLIWAMLVTLFILDVVWSARVGLSIGGWGITIGVVGSLLALSAVYRRRSNSIADMAEAGAVWVAFTATGAVLTYLAAIVARPLQDAAVSNFDHTIGFDWLVWRNAVLTRPLLHGILQLAYASLLPQIVLAIAYFPKLGLAERNAELVLLAMLTLLPTTLISALWPVLGPFATFAASEGTVPAGSAGVARRRSLAFRTCGHGRHCRDAILSHGAGGIVHLRVSRHRAGRIGVSRGSMRSCCWRSRRSVATTSAT